MSRKSQKKTFNPIQDVRILLEKIKQRSESEKKKDIFSSQVKMDLECFRKNDIHIGI